MPTVNHHNIFNGVGDKAAKPVAMFQENYKQYGKNNACFFELPRI